MSSTSNRSKAIDKWDFLLIANLLVVSCTPDSPPAATLALEHLSINSQIMAARFSGQVVQAAANQPNAVTFMNGTPKHLRFAFDNDQLSNLVLYRQRQLLLEKAIKEG